MINRPRDTPEQVIVAMMLDHADRLRDTAAVLRKDADHYHELVSRLGSTKGSPELRAVSAMYSRSGEAHAGYARRLTEMAEGIEREAPRWEGRA